MPLCARVPHCSCRTTQSADPNEITDWSRIAEGVPGRSNKDCRKRWVNKVCGGLNKGPWSREEDQRLRKAMEVHGSKYAHPQNPLVGWGENEASDV